jgi:hypothetical protein
MSALGQEGVSLENGFGNIEKTGLLRQFLRCVPVGPDYSADIVTCLQLYLQIIKKKLKSGTPTGDILDAVITGKESQVCPRQATGFCSTLQPQQP